MTRQQILQKARAVYRENLSRTFESRFWARVKRGPKDECWPWIGGKRNKSGYGRVAYLQTYKASHRTAWELTNGPIPEGKWVLHKCDNPTCCNPNHLYIGTVLENVADMIRNGRKKVFPGQLNPMWGKGGERHVFAKLSNADVAEIRKAYGPRLGSRWKPGNVKQVDLARRFGVSQAVVSSILRGNHRRNG